jgi:predicted MPP superfamily phosphohydrolase
MRSVFWVCAVLLLGVAVDAFLVEPRWLEENTYTIQSDKITQPLRLVLVADLQTDHVTSYERRVFRRVMDAKPDMILFAGDYLQVETQEEWERELPKLRQVFTEVGLVAPRGIYAVAGNVDHPSWPQIFDGVGAFISPDTSTFEATRTTATDDALRVTCLSLRDSFDTQLTLAAAAPDRGHDLLRDQDDEPENVPAFHIILGHGPDFALSDVEADLMLAGHVHGGQVRLPGFGPLVTLARVPRAWTSGLTSLADGRTLVISRGIGMERAAAPRLRFFCRPQLIILDIVPSS